MRRAASSLALQRMHMHVRFFSANAGGDAVKVFGHKNPDTDATCGAILRTFELQQHGGAAEAFVLGGLNKETEYVLERFSIPAPPLLGPLNADDKVRVTPRRMWC